eukprot:1857823-Prymnesium_polylepis.2
MGKSQPPPTPLMTFDFIISSHRFLDDPDGQVAVGLEGLRGFPARHPAAVGAAGGRCANDRHLPKGGERLRLNHSASPELTSL